MRVVRLDKKIVKCLKCKAKIGKKDWIFMAADKLYKTCCDSCQLIFEVKKVKDEKNTIS